LISILLIELYYFTITLPSSKILKMAQAQAQVKTQAQAEAEAIDELLSYQDLLKLLEESTKNLVDKFSLKKEKLYSKASNNINDGKLSRLTKQEAMSVSSGLGDPGIHRMIAKWAELASLNEQYKELQIKMDIWINIIIQRFSSLTLEENLEELEFKFFFFLQKPVPEQLLLISKITNANIIPYDYDSSITPLDIAIEVDGTGTTEEFENIVQKLMNPVPIANE
jgi:hypothetical protein